MANARGAGLNDLVEKARRSWAGRLFVGDRALVYAGPLGPTTMHAHHAHQIVLARPIPAVLRSRPGEATPCDIAVIPADAAHAILQPVASALVVYLDADDWDGRRIRALEIAGDSVAAWRSAGTPLAAMSTDAPASWSAAQELVQTTVRQLLGDIARPPVVHPAVKRALRLVPAAMERGSVRLPALASEAGVSASRLAHLFSAQVGIPLRPYVLWLRLQRAALSLQQGRSITDAAHEAGFADAAHLSRVCRRMFGIAPSAIANVIEWVPPPATGAEPKPA